ncbi:MAG: TonB-dependent receptor [Candidatus Azotimanducaceae bacterium WSBS_2022_MAG_OTU7]
MKYITLPIGVVALLIAHSALSDHHKQLNHHSEEEIVVSAPFQKKVADTALPVTLLKGENYRKQVANSLGETLQNQPGIQSSSFGPGVGQAVIRGQSGNRVQVLQNSVNTIDVSAISPDHANGVEPLLATGIEVVRGPATLLYGNGAIGGIVNVLDERIPKAPFSAPEFSIEQSHNAVNDEHKSVAKLNFSTGALNFHLDAISRGNNEVDINGYAIDELVISDGNTHGFVANSDADASGHTIGTSISGAWGFIGLSRNELDNEYGLPPGSHGHEDDEAEEDHEEDEHEEDEHEEDEHGEEDHGEEQEFIRIDMTQTRYDLRGEYALQGAFVERLSGSVSYTIYEHSELETNTEGRFEPGTKFENEGLEARFTLTHTPVGNWVGQWGAQIGDSEFSAQGEEAFIPKTERRNYALFGIERWKSGKTTLELGVRVERNKLDPGGNCDHHETTSSVSASALRDLGQNTSLLVSLSRSQRAPTLEERYSNIQTRDCAPDPGALVLHAATGLFEIGEPELDIETASNLEIGISRHSENWTGEFNLYYNRISDYIYLLETGVNRFDQPTAYYRAQDTTFYGAEARLGHTVLQTGQGSLEARLQGDFVRASFDKGGNVPRLPPARLGAGLLFSANTWSLDLALNYVFSQNRTATDELDTGGHTLLEFYGDYHFSMGETELLMFVRGTNLLDEEVRNHMSFLKNSAPEAGRGVRVGVRFSY